MVIKSKVFRNTYRDSILLMKIASMVKEKTRVKNVELILATEPNKNVLSRTQLLTEDVQNAGPNDLIICVMAEDEETANKAIHDAEEMVTKGTVFQQTKRIAKSLYNALAILPEANLALISIPGIFVKKEAAKALKKGLNLLIFSNNVPIEDEVEIKRLAKEKGLIVMGPDCGTAIIGGVALGFANKVNKGNIGLIGASGTGLQEVSVILHNLGIGISHAIGTGSNDVSKEVCGLTMIQGIEWLEADPNTKIIVIISKPPASITAHEVLTHLRRCTKPVVVNFLGVYDKSFQESNIYFTTSLEETARKVAQIEGKLLKYKALFSIGKGTSYEFRKKIKKNLLDTQKYVRGLFSGGTLALEACIILKEMVSEVYGNISLSWVTKLLDSKVSKGHCIIDLGADEFTLGKPHPMLEPEMRKERLLAEAKDPEVAVILLDFVLGYGAHPDPVGVTIPYIEEAKRITRQEGRYISIVASVCGTDEDPQNRSEQRNMLEEHGVIVLPNNAQAARFAALAALRL